jgi:hypothetical protein
LKIRTREGNFLHVSLDYEPPSPRRGVGWTLERCRCHLPNDDGAASGGTHAQRAAHQRGPLSAHRPKVQQPLSWSAARPGTEHHDTLCLHTTCSPAMHVAQGLGPVRVLAKNQMPWDGSIDSCPPPTFSTRRYRQEAGESLLRAHSSEMKAECSVYDYDGEGQSGARLHGPLLYLRW